MTAHYRRRQLKNRLAVALSTVCAAGGVFFLFWILNDLTFEGLRHLDFSVLTIDTPGPDDPGGGLRNAIVGSLLVTFWCMVIAIPIGILAGTWLSEYGRDSRLAELIRFVNHILLSAPSIIVGVFIYQLMVDPKGFISLDRFSGWAGAAALALIAIPKIVVSTENILRLVPSTTREAAFALGAPKHRVIVDVAYRAATSGICTGLLLALAQVTGETAPLLFTALGNQFLNLNMSQPIATLPPTIYSFALSPYERWKELAWAGSFLIALFILTLNIFVRTTFRTIRR
ncbi:MAG TPA: phosphate ABC transporter permease PstA [Bryobacteraceae bacterium]|jgi:phosphate transport system permease protein|nr:phosphate ABC transporter permease PstA [Bryobacteraceae bacterium]